MKTETKNHQVTFKELHAFILTQTVTLASAFGEEENKALRAKLSGGFIVENKGTIVWEGIQLNAAVEKYNEI